MRLNAVIIHCNYVLQSEIHYIQLGLRRDCITQRLLKLIKFIDVSAIWIRDTNWSEFSSLGQYTFGHRMSFYQTEITLGDIDRLLNVS